MCGLCKLNAAALDTTVACGYNGIDQHNLGLLPPIAGIDTIINPRMIFTPVYCPPSRGLIQGFERYNIGYFLLPPIAGIDTFLFHVLPLVFFYCPPSRGLIQRLLDEFHFYLLLPPLRGLIFHTNAAAWSSSLLPPIAGIVTPCRERSAAQRRRPFHSLPSTFHTPSLRSPPHFPFR